MITLEKHQLLFKIRNNVFHHWTLEVEDTHHNFSFLLRGAIYLEQISVGIKLFITVHVNDETTRYKFGV